jgi:glycosyltransferase involved in cell wall biosynthesis
VANANGAQPRATIQLCTYNRARLLERVLDACFEQALDPALYEIVLVDDGSSDETPAVIEAAAQRATCAFTVIRQANAGLAHGRNAGIAKARGERIIFIDDDVLPTPPFVAEHLRSHDRTPHAIVRGGVINTASFDLLPPPNWSPLNYSGNYFWTTNVSVPLATLRNAGGFSEQFKEYGWEDIELGLRLRFAGVPSLFNQYALVYHFKPPPIPQSIGKMCAQARAQARTAVELRRMHPHWRVVLATGEDPLRRALHSLLRRAGVPELLRRSLRGAASARTLSPPESLAAHLLAKEAYYEELETARAAAP